MCLHLTYLPCTLHLAPPKRTVFQLSTSDSVLSFRHPPTTPRHSFLTPPRLHDKNNNNTTTLQGIGSSWWLASEDGGVFYTRHTGEAMVSSISRSIPALPPRPTAPDYHHYVTSLLHRRWMRVCALVLGVCFVESWLVTTKRGRSK